MKQEGLRYFTDMYLIWIGFFIFFITFIALVIRVYQKKDKSFYEKMASLPLKKEGSE